MVNRVQLNSRYVVHVCLTHLHQSREPESCAYQERCFRNSQRSHTNIDRARVETSLRSELQRAGEWSGIIFAALLLLMILIWIYCCCACVFAAEEIGNPPYLKYLSESRVPRTTDKCHHSGLHMSYIISFVYGYLYRHNIIYYCHTLQATVKCLRSGFNLAIYITIV